MRLGRVMVLGSGWAVFKLVREMDKHKYQVVSVSHRYSKHNFSKLNEQKETLVFVLFIEINSFSHHYLQALLSVHSNSVALRNQFAANQPMLNTTKHGATKWIFKIIKFR